MNHFTKKNPIPGSSTLKNELNGLKEFRHYQSKHSLNLPKVIKCSDSELILEKIESTHPTTTDWIKLGKGLYNLHQITSDQFGFYEDNYCGMNTQINSYSNNWGEFFINNRIEHQINLIKSTSFKIHLNELIQDKKELLIFKLNEHSPKPSLVHGDLWVGNVMFDKTGPWLIDPAVYYGDCETDLAMTELFAGFSKDFYQTYFSLYQKPKGFDYRAKLYKLYHYLNHYNVYGDSYKSSIEKIIRELF